MNVRPCPPPTSCPASDEDDALPRPSAEALLAATLALMTGVVERAALAQPLAAHGQSLVMAAKVRSNLFFLLHHPQLSEGFRMTLGRLRTHWDRLLAPAADGDGPDVAPASTQALPPMWHRAPRGLQ